MPLSAIACFVRVRLSASEGGLPDAFLAAAALALEDACASRALDASTLPGESALPPSAALAVHHLELEQLAQRNAYARMVGSGAPPVGDGSSAHADDRRARRDRHDGRTLASTPALRAPVLRVDLFGGLEVSIGGVPVDPARFRRLKVKTLLALLVLNRGHEIPRDRLVSMLWPHCGLEGARRNFYGIWSMLRRSLATPDGECPYLVRLQNGCKIDASLLETDLDDLDAVCRALLFEPVDLERWTYLYREINGRFADDLLPSDEGNNSIDQGREACRCRLVDALVAASSRLAAAGEHQAALWFARAALERDRTREDAYTTLMQAQIDVGQRTAALATYFACRRFLTNELGIDPSVRTMRLYHDIIEEEESFD